MIHVKSKFRVGVTMRSRNFEKRDATEDTIDQAWWRLAIPLEIDLFPIPNRLQNPVAFFDDLKLNAIILSGGNNLSSGWINSSGDIVPSMPLLEDVSIERDQTEASLLQHISTRGNPVIGVCRGMQMLATYHGGTLRALTGHVAKKHSIHPTGKNNNYELWKDCAGNVNSFHQLGLFASDLPPCLEPRLVATDGSVEAATHTKLNQIGIMWHPERFKDPRQADIALLKHYLRKTQDP